MRYSNFSSRGFVGSRRSIAWRIARRRITHAQPFGISRAFDEQTETFNDNMATIPLARKRVMTTEQQAHWENVYSTKGEAEVSWFQEVPKPSLDLLALVGATGDPAIIDIGGGASRLVDALLAIGFKDISVLDLSAEALNVAHARLGDTGNRVKWIVADATEWEPPQQYDLWHDRAAFHFLNGEQQQRAYIARMKRSLRIGGHIIMGTFALDGPEKCSGLPVTRHSAESLASLLGADFALVDARNHQHATPSGAVQRFQFCTFRRIV